MNELTPEETKSELQKCIDSPYYFATKYMLISDGCGNTYKFTTRLLEDEFNEMCKLTPIHPRRSRYPNIMPTQIQISKEIHRHIFPNASEGNVPKYHDEDELRAITRQYSQEYLEKLWSGLRPNISEGSGSAIITSTPKS